eukprot:gene25654-11318_t
MSHIGFYMSPAGTSGATAHSAFVLTLRCLADQPIDWSTKVSSAVQRSGGAAAAAAAGREEETKHASSTVDGNRTVEKK